MSLPLLLFLLAVCAALLLIERSGVPMTLQLHFKGDVKRETRWLAQYGQAVCTMATALLVWDLDDEVQHYVEQAASAYVAGGLSPDAARRLML